MSTLKSNSFFSTLIIALFLDGFDFILGWIPIIGDIIDIIGIIILYPKIGSYALIGAVELIPAMDFIPFFTGAVIVSRIMGNKGGK